MDRYQDILENLLASKNEYEWLDFKENWFSKDGIGEYISAISNSAALCGKECGYVIWGVSDKTREVVGTKVSLDLDMDGEPYKHYLARKLSPSIPFETINLKYQGKDVLMLIIPAARSIKTTFDKVAYVRIGSSKERLDRFPEWDIRLSNTLQSGLPTIVNTPAPDYAQDLTFEKLFVYYGAKGIPLRSDTFERTLKLRTRSGEFNVMAYILSDQNSIPIRISVFSGTDKTAPLFSVKEYGNNCILYSLDKVLEYGDAIDIIQADERNRISERKDVPLFNYEAFREAVLNAFEHNKWLTLNGPAITIFTDRIEILSHGGLAVDQDESGFFNGVSIPVNEILASIFLQLRISERSGRGVPKIVGCYGRKAISIEKNRIVVTIPFNRIDVNRFEIDLYRKPSMESPRLDDQEPRKLNATQKRIVKLIGDDPSITSKKLSQRIGLSEVAIKKNLQKLKSLGIVQRIGANKNGYWRVVNSKKSK